MVISPRPLGVVRGRLQWAIVTPLRIDFMHMILRYTIFPKKWAKRKDDEIR